jgi:hypothetical protein
VLALINGCVGGDQKFQSGFYNSTELNGVVWLTLRPIRLNFTILIKFKFILSSYKKNKKKNKKLYS